MSEDNWDLDPNKYTIHILSGRISKYRCSNYKAYAPEIITWGFSVFFFFLLGGIKTSEYKQRKFVCSFGLLVSWALFALLPGLQKRVRYCVTVFSLSEWKSGLLQRNFPCSCWGIPQKKVMQRSPPLTGLGSKAESSRRVWEVGHKKPFPLPHPEAERTEGTALENWFFFYFQE